MRKRRTREHVIADLSANFVERSALQCGYAVERVAKDYGVDLILSTFDGQGAFENGFIFIQLKATDHLRRLENGNIAFAIERADLEWWLDEEQPVILVIYDASADVAYWLYIQAYFEAQKGFHLSRLGKTATVHIEETQVVNADAIRQFAMFRDRVKEQRPGRIRHHA